MAEKKQKLLKNASKLGFDKLFSNKSQKELVAYYVFNHSIYEEIKDEKLIRAMISGIRIFGALCCAASAIMILIVGYIASPFIAPDALLIGGSGLFALLSYVCAKVQNESRKENEDKVKGNKDKLVEKEYLLHLIQEGYVKNDSNFHVNLHKKRVLQDFVNENYDRTDLIKTYCKMISRQSADYIRCCEDEQNKKEDDKKSPVVKNFKQIEKELVDMSSTNASLKTGGKSNHSENGSIEDERNLDAFLRL